MNAFERLVKDLDSGELSILHLELAYRAHIKKRKDIPKGAKNLLIGTCDANRGCLEFAQEVKLLVGAVHLAYLRGKQEGEETIKSNT